MSVTEYVAQQTERMAEALAHFITTMPEDKLRWQPNLGDNPPCRSAYHQIGECIAVNHGFAKMMRGEAVSPPPREIPEPAFATPQEAQAQLTASARELAAAIRNLSDEDLAHEYQHPRGTMRGENFILMAYRNMAYHAGQINFIQTLYGDTEFHVPPNWR